MDGCLYPEYMSCESNTLKSIGEHYRHSEYVTASAAYFHALVLLGGQDVLFSLYESPQKENCQADS